MTENHDSSDLHHNGLVEKRVPVIPLLLHRQTLDRPSGPFFPLDDRKCCLGSLANHAFSRDHHETTGTLLFGNTKLQTTQTLTSSTATPPV